MQDTQSFIRPVADKTAISLSLLCALHCLLTPIAMVLLPSLAGLGLDDEAFHKWMVFAVVPISVFALFLGCRKHRRWWVLGIGLGGVSLLCLAVYLGHDALGENGERAMTLMGALMIAASHVQNFRLCRSLPANSCPEDVSGNC
ncbi:MAG: hypothetical protein Cons2KO_34900 [Congregibacter sp.]